MVAIQFKCTYNQYRTLTVWHKLKDNCFDRYRDKQFYNNKDSPIDDEQIIDVSIDIQIDRFIVIDRQIDTIVNRYTKELIYNYRQIDR